MRLLLTIILLVISNAVYALEYKTVRDQLILSGTIEAADISKMPAYLTPAINTVVFNNIDGGDATTTLKMLSLFEEHPRVHVVKGYCASACTLFFLAGQERYIDTKDSFIGFHSVYSYDTNKINPQLGAVFNNYIAVRLGSKYDPQLFTFVFKGITDNNGFLIFNSGNNGKYCNKSKCVDKTMKTAFDLGIVTDKHVF